MLNPKLLYPKLILKYAQSIFHFTERVSAHISNKAILRLIFVMPIMQLILIPLAADYEVKNISITVVDQDHSTYSQRLIQKIQASQYFKIVAADQNYQDAIDLTGSNKTDLILTIPPQFEVDLIKSDQATLHIAADAVNGIRAGLGTAYASAMIQRFNQEIRDEWVQLPKVSPLPIIEVTSVNWFNPHINYRLFMVPGILAILVTMVGAFLTSLNIVEEKEIRNYRTNQRNSD